MSQVKEIWKPIPSYEGFYEISDQGRVRSLPRCVACNGHTINLKGRLLKPALTSNDAGKGYLYVVLCRDGKPKNELVHRLVLRTFVGSCPTGLETLHGVNGRLDNSLNNLKYGTRSENRRDQRRDGTECARKVKRSDGRVFLSVRAAARHSGTAHQNIIQVCKGCRNKAGGFGWKYMT
jgi:hypothetical protein